MTLVKGNKTTNKTVKPRPVEVSKLKPFKDSNGFRARFKGYEGLAIAGQETTIDFLIAEERFIAGGVLLLKNHKFGDKASYYIVDKDGLYFPAGTILDNFVEDWYIFDDSEKQIDVISNYPAKIYSGLYMRVVYTSTGLDDVEFKLNLYLHKTP